MTLHLAFILVYDSPLPAHIFIAEIVARDLP